MSSQEKLAILRVRAKGLRERALVVERAFQNEAVIRTAAAVRTEIEQELDRLERGAVEPLPSLQRFLPGPTAALKNLEALLRRAGPSATARELPTGRTIADKASLKRS